MVLLGESWEVLATPMEFQGPLALELHWNASLSYFSLDASLDRRPSDLHLSFSPSLSLSLLFQHFVFVLGTIEDILFVVDSVVLLGFDMATIGFGLLNVLHQYICICIS